MNAFIKLGVIEPLAQALYQQGIRSVSYTHLTLPTSDLV